MTELPGGCVCGRRRSREDHRIAHGGDYRVYFAGVGFLVACASCRLVYVATEEEWKALPEVAPDQKGSSRS